MRRWFLCAWAAVGLLGAVPVAASAAPPSVAYKSCSAGWKHAVLRDGSHKCLRTGQFCASRNERVYRSKGLTSRAGRLRTR